MFVPSIESLTNALNVDKSALNGDGTITVPAKLLRLLLQIALASSDFDEDTYLRQNPDVAKAISRNEIESARVHYIGFGYFEGRLGGCQAVDSTWYLSKYPDVAAAVKDGRVTSAEAHFHFIGGGEGRSPAPEYEPDAAQWKAALRGK